MAFIIAKLTFTTTKTVKSKPNNPENAATRASIAIENLYDVTSSASEIPCMPTTTCIAVRATVMKANSVMPAAKNSWKYVTYSRCVVKYVVCRKVYLQI